ncbi:hypothetical protein [Sulfitobacter sp. SK012]|nr:hypothetical protein [Sulfitobacter sp. SK012]
MKTPLGKLVTGAALWAVLCAPLAHADHSNADTAAVLAEIRDTMT